MEENKIKAPDFAFKFYSINRFEHLIQVLIEHQLYFAFVSEFNNNDMLDCKTFKILTENENDINSAINHYIETNFKESSEKQKIEEFEKRINYYSKGNRYHFAKMLAEGIEKTYKQNWDKNSLGILCLAEHPTKEMWKRYCNNYNGFCLQIDLRKVIKALDTNKITKIGKQPKLYEYGKIEYVPDLIEIGYQDFNNNIDVNTHKMLYTKMNSYKFEKEIRIAIPEILTKNIFINNNFIKRLYIGQHTNQEYINKIMQINKIREYQIEIKQF